MTVHLLPVRSENADAVGYVCTTPEEGCAQLDALIALGCKPHHRVLEIGCGALIAGYPVMRYLDAGNYVGVDPNAWLREQSLRIPEIGRAAEERRARFYSRSDFRAGQDERFDFILSHSILSHASDRQLTEFLAAAFEQLAPGGTLAASLRLAEGNAVGSPGSAVHGAHFAEWQYPGVSWFRQVDVVDRALREGLLARVDPELTRIITGANPKAVHDWLVASPDPAHVAAPRSITRGPVTLVTAFFRLPDRPVDEDEQFRRFAELAASGLPILLFLDEQLMDRAPKYPNVRVVPANRIKSLWSFSLAVGRELKLPSQRNREKDTRDFLLLQNAKIDMLEWATELDDQATHFAWIDFAIMKVVRDPAKFLDRLGRLAPPASCVLAPGCWSRDRADQDSGGVNWRFCGGFLLADRESVSGLVSAYRTEFAKRVTHHGKLTWEVNVWAAMERAGARFDWYQADHDDSIIGGAQRVCLCMIVKNEGAVIERCLEAALPFIDTWAITDTGSTDDTPERIQRFFASTGSDRQVPGKIFRTTFRNFSQARNEALTFAKTVPGWDYALLIDADMVIGGSLDRAALSAPAYKLMQQTGDLDYWNTRLLRRTATATYVGVTHEFLSVDGAENLPGLTVQDRADGGSRGDKADRDIRLLSEDLGEHPTNERSMFYLAQTYRGIGRHHEAIQWYRRRVERGGWDEEVWASYYGIACSYRDLGDEPNLAKASLDAYNFRPSRGEPLKLLAKFYRERGKNEAACLVAETLATIDYPSDQLFVERECYDFGADQELAIAGFWSKLPRRREAGYQACARLTVACSHFIREEARKNFTHYAKSAHDLLDAEVRAIDWKPDDGYAPMNPSVCVGADGRRLVLVRTVNYTVTSEGQYPTVDDSGVIKTRNHVVEVDADWKPVRSTLVEDVSELPRSQYPVEGFEDCRIWQEDGRYFASTTVRDLADNPDGRCEIAVVEFDERWRVTDVTPIRDYEGGKTQKNWMPIAGRPGQFLYLCDPTTVIDVGAGGRTVERARHAPPACLADLRGGSQLIAHDGGWLCITHEVAWRPERVYLHRFVKFAEDFRVVAVSDPFYFLRVGIEFCAGLARDGDRLVASFGVNDATAHLALFDPDSVDRHLTVLR